MEKTGQESDFIRGLGLFDSTMIVAGSMIGSGIFIVSADIARQVNSAWLLLLVWIITGIMTIIGALTFAELAAAMPKAGGVYVFLKEAWSELVGFAYGWTLLLVIQTGTIAAVAVATAKFLGVIFPWITSTTMLINIGSFHFLSVEQFVAISSLIILTWINCTGVKSGAIVQNVFTIAKVIALLGLIIIGLFFYTSANPANTAALPIVPHVANNTNYLFGLYSVIAIASVGALFSSDAWFGVTFLAAEVKDASRILPLALLFGTGLVSVLYILANVSYLKVLGLPGIQMAAEDRVGTAAISQMFGSSGAIIMAAIILVSTIGCNNGLIMSGARVFWAMAKDNLFFKQIGSLDPKSHAPVKSLIIQCIWASVICLSGQYSQILDYVICAGLVFYILTILGVFRLRKTQPDLPRPYKVVGYPVLPIIYLIFAFFIIFNLLLYKPLYCWPGLIIVLSGVPVYYIWKSLQNKRNAYETK